MTTYDHLWSTFLNKTKIDDLELPTTDAKIYQTIQGAILSFNNRLRDNLSGDNATEQLSRELDGDHLLILAHYIRLSVLENQLIYFSNTWQPFGKDIGVKNFGNQMVRLENLVESEKAKIEQFIINMAVDFL